MKTKVRNKLDIMCTMGFPSKMAQTEVTGRAKIKKEEVFQYMPILAIKCRFVCESSM